MLSESEFLWTLGVSLFNKNKLNKLNKLNKVIKFCFDAGAR